jgi:hypothetical protein
MDKILLSRKYANVSKLDRDAKVRSLGGSSTFTLH